jgi:ABC-type nitrate/sulfonate/bicarbonate transport system ATPase subunit
VALLLVTHDVDDALSLAARTIVMTSNPGGRITAHIDTPKTLPGSALYANQRARLLASLESEPQTSPHRDMAVSV